MSRRRRGYIGRGGGGGAGRGGSCVRERRTEEDRGFSMYKTKKQGVGPAF